ncbi:MAG: zinc-dependent alcohol dehydrogenase family protein [Alphaproteobacteria bacterium]|jgi:mitochondrial enoyl-[acyl-carrier protein] reductase / trans-2-enoyl-CoA reductase|nr:zinc-dependent alcohol dehydrogenase family protein [Alphaproteobacteria bacterium]MBT4082977.1 zinc-dependent alcohol dehydrogenase family protein [Alphaproteobacteria bacterium]MBT4543448.1 zinc-dependent alcohol dehydrogenase family protein [Alphaproteobacteria bacterium]MBT7745658.1 zinc-dependent alcohol dehydrogenase family protein [Alphaproteobacteria bacterium]
MKIVQYAERGNPVDVVKVLEVDAPSAGPGEVVLDVLASPINPSDVLTVTGDYGILPPLPAYCGNEGVGRVASLGEGVEDIAVGQQVFLPVGAGTWRQQITAKAAEIVPVPPGTDPLQMAMLTINPPTAYLMLRDFVRLEPGDWVIQNASNSGVGRYVIQLAAAQGAKSINIVRRAELADELKAMGADAVVVEGPGMSKEVREITGGAPVKLGLDAIGGDSTLALGDCLTDDGVVVNYGLLSGEPCKLSSAATIFHDVTLRGFWLARWFRNAPIGERMAVVTEIAGRIATGELVAAVDSTYDLDHISDALARSMAGSRDGKVLVTPNGPIDSQV